MNFIKKVYLVGRSHGKFITRHKKYGDILRYVARGIYFLLTGKFPEEIIRQRTGFRHFSTKINETVHDAQVNAESSLDIENIRKYLDQEYWEQGIVTGKSGYQGICSFLGITESIGVQFTEALHLDGKKLLDLGCASGQTVKAFRGQGVDAYGLDLSDYAIDAGIKTFGLKQTIYQGSCHDLSRWLAGEFDFLFSNQVLEHLPEQYVPALVKECFRVLKPGGTIWIGLVLSLSPDPEGVRPANDPDETHINLHYRSWWNDHFLSAGFVLDEQCMELVQATPIWFEFGWHHLAYRKL